MLPRTALVFPFTATITGQHEGRSHARVYRQLNVTVAVSYHPTPVQINRKITNSSLNEARSWLPAITTKPVGRFTHRWMMSAIVECVEVCAGNLQVGIETIMDCKKHLFLKITSGNTCLICHPNRQPVVVIKYLDGLRRIREKSKARHVIDVANLFGKSAIAVHENSGSFHPVLSGD